MRSRISGLVLTLLAGTAFVACDSSESDSSAKGEVTSTTSAASTTSARTGGFDYAHPEVAQVVAGGGNLVGISPDGSSFLISAQDKAHTKDTCEGEPQEILQLVPATGGSRRPILEGTKPFIGQVLRASTGKIAVIGRCEEFMGEISLADQAPDGLLSNRRAVNDANLPPNGPNSVHAWSWDGASLVGSTSGDSKDPMGQIAWTLDPLTGKVTQRYRGHQYGIGVMTDGLFVIDDGEKSNHIFIRDAKEQTGPTGDGGAFIVSPDGKRVATYGLYGRPLGILTPTSYDIVAESPSGEVIFQVIWSPDGAALAFVTQPEKTGSVLVNHVYIVDLASRTRTEVSGDDGRYDSLLFSPQGDALGWNRWGTGDADDDIMWAKFRRT